MNADSHGLPKLGNFPGLPESALGESQKTLIEEFRSRRGLIPGPYRIWLSSPDFAERQKALSDYVIRGGLLSPRECEIAVLVLAQRRGVPYIEVAHRKIAAAAGVSEAIIDAICRGRIPQFADEREEVVYLTALAMVDGATPGPDVVDRAALVLGHDGVSEISGLLGFYCACAFILTYYGAEPPGA